MDKEKKQKNNERSFMPNINSAPQGANESNSQLANRLVKEYGISKPENSPVKKEPRTIRTSIPTQQAPEQFRAKSQDQIQRDMTRSAQGEINSLGNYYDTLAAESRAVGQQNLNETGAINTLSGLGGSTEGAYNNSLTRKESSADLKRVESERNLATQALLGNIRRSAVTEAANQRIEQRQSEQDRITFRTQAKEEAINNLTLLSSSGTGASIEGLRSTLDEQSYNALISNAGGEAIAASILFNSRSRNEVIGDVQFIGGQAVQQIMKPDGTTAFEKVPLPEGVMPDAMVEKTKNGILYSNDGGQNWSQAFGPGQSGGGTGTGTGSGTGIGPKVKELTATEKSQANFLAKQLYGGSTIKTKDGYANFVLPIIQRMEAGESIDDISDSLRFSGQSEEFTGSIRDAGQQITSNYSDKKTQIIFDKMDDLLDQDNPGKVKDYLKKIAVDSLGTAEAQQVRGKERTMEFLLEIGNDLDTLERNGVKTNIFSGTQENISKAAGGVKNEEMRKIATKIATAIQSYRRSMSGVAFSVPESKEYESMFPSVSKTKNFNSANIGALLEVFDGDLNFTYKFLMGKDAYEDIFEQQAPNTQKQNEIITAPDGQQIEIIPG